MSTALDKLVGEVRRCRLCAEKLAHEPRPIIHVGGSAKLLIIGQAPGRKVHASGIPWNDPSGDRLRRWLGLDREQFYDTEQIAIMPMGFCYPGHGKSGDLPPRPECAPHWHAKLKGQLPNIGLTLLIGRYAIQYYRQPDKKQSLADIIQHQDLSAAHLVLPHPSPRNIAWFKQHDWFERAMIPKLRAQVSGLLDRDDDTRA